MTFDEAYKAIRRNKLELLRDAFDKGLNPDLARDNNGYTLLMVAAGDGNTTIGRLLIERGADLNLKDNRGGSALSCAAMTGHSPFVSLLLKGGASVENAFPDNSLDSFLNWIESYCVRPVEKMVKIREAFQATNHENDDCGK